MQSVEVQEFDKIMKGEIGDKEQLDQIHTALKKIFEQNGKFLVVDSLENKEFLIEVKDNELKYKIHKKDDSKHDKKHDKKDKKKKKKDK